MVPQTCRGTNNIHVGKEEVPALAVPKKKAKGNFVDADASLDAKVLELEARLEELKEAQLRAREVKGAKGGHTRLSLSEEGEIADHSHYPRYFLNGTISVGDFKRPGPGDPGYVIHSGHKTLIDM